MKILSLPYTVLKDGVPASRAASLIFINPNESVANLRELVQGRNMHSSLKDVDANSLEVWGVRPP